MFMVLSSWQSHCESSLGSFDECRTAPSGRRPKTKPDDLGCESACTGCQNLHLGYHRHLLLLLSPKADTHFTVPQRVKGWVDLAGWLHTEMVYPSTDGHPFPGTMSGYKYFPLGGVWGDQQPPLLLIHGTLSVSPKVIELEVKIWQTRRHLRVLGFHIEICHLCLERSGAVHLFWYPSISRKLINLGNRNLCAVWHLHMQGLHV